MGAVGLVEILFGEGSRNGGKEHGQDQSERWESHGARIYLRLQESSNDFPAGLAFRSGKSRLEKNTAEEVQKRLIGLSRGGA